MEIKCTFLEKKPSICMSFDGMRPCLEFNNDGSLKKKCEYLEIEEEEPEVPDICEDPRCSNFGKPLDEFGECPGQFIKEKSK